MFLSDAAPPRDTIEIDGQTIELVRDRLYEFGFRFPRHTTLVARFLRVNGRDIALRTEAGKIVHRSIADLENLWDPPLATSARDTSSDS